MAEFTVLGFLFLSISAYVISGGADFGVGILEVFARGEDRARIRKQGERAIAPVWEANHIWVIVALVILFVAYPKIHVTIMTNLHVPILLMLVGIILRGTAFTFRYYDVEDDPKVERFFGYLFHTGSLLVPMMFGHVVAAMGRGRIQAVPGTVWDTYLMPWIGVFPLLTGVWTVILFGWLGAVFLLSEAAPDEFEATRRSSRIWTVLLVFVGGLVTASAFLEDASWFSLVDPVAIIAVTTATVALTGIWRTLSRPNAWVLRGLASLVTVSLLVGYFGPAYPQALALTDGRSLAWSQSLAPAATIELLAGALIVASLLIGPSLIYLYRVFKMPAKR